LTRITATAAVAATTVNRRNTKGISVCSYTYTPTNNHAGRVAPARKKKIMKLPPPQPRPQKKNAKEPNRQNDEIPSDPRNGIFKRSVINAEEDIVLLLLLLLLYNRWKHIFRLAERVRFI
jgi:hypothetical protein